MFEGQGFAILAMFLRKDWNSSRLGLINDKLQRDTQQQQENLLKVIKVHGKTVRLIQADQNLKIHQ